MRDWADLGDASIKTFDQRKNVSLLRELLWTGERILAVGRAGHPRGRLRSGLLTVTDQRVVFVAERFLRQPFVLSLPFTQIRSIELAEEPITGTLALDTTRGAVTFPRVRPKERTWPLYWRISERIAKVPLGGHS
jgi:hypothetical protein